MKQIAHFIHLYNAIQNGCLGIAKLYLKDGTDVNFAIFMEKRQIVL